MGRNPIEDAGRALRVLGDRLRETAGPEGEWIADRLERLTGDGQERESEPTLAELQAELDSLVGLGSVKEQVRALVAFLQVQALRKQSGLAEVATSQHLVFLGNPGTGKTTVARLLAGMYRAMGLLRRGHLVEVDRAGLVGEWVGSTAIKTDRVIRRALDGVLFIDEAYALGREPVRGNVDFGAEAVETLLKRMEDFRERLVVIVAGYPRLMHAFLDSNPGLRSRFAREITFPDYSTDELLAIARKFASENEYALAEEAEPALRTIFDRAPRSEGFGNARFARTLFEQAVNMRALRLAREGLESPSLAELKTLSSDDVRAGAQAVGEDPGPAPGAGKPFFRRRRSAP